MGANTSGSTCHEVLPSNMIGGRPTHQHHGSMEETWPINIPLVTCLYFLDDGKLQTSRMERELPQDSSSASLFALCSRMPWHSVIDEDSGRLVVCSYKFSCARDRGSAGP
jgi:hypothetical protein